MLNQRYITNPMRSFSGACKGCGIMETCSFQIYPPLKIVHPIWFDRDVFGSSRSPGACGISISIYSSLCALQLLQETASSSCLRHAAQKDRVPDVVGRWCSYRVRRRRGSSELVQSDWEIRELVVSTRFASALRGPDDLEILWAWLHIFVWRQRLWNLLKSMTT